MTTRKTRLSEDMTVHAGEQMSVGEWWDYLVGELGIDPDDEHVAAVELDASGQDLVLEVLVRGNLRDCLLAASETEEMVHIMPAEEFEQASVKLH